MKPRRAKLATNNSPDNEPVRAVVTRRNQWKKGIVNCPLLPAPVQHESALEKSFIQRAILCAFVECIRHQPYRFGKHTLDFELRLHANYIAVEVKLARKVPNYIAVFNNTAARLAVRGIRFYVITEHEIRSEHSDEQAAEVLRYAKTKVTLEEHARVLAALTASGAMTASRLQELAGVDSQALQHMVVTRMLACAPTLVVDERSTLSIAPLPMDPVGHFETYFGIRPWVAQPEPTPRPRGKHTLKRREKRVGPVLRQHTASEEKDCMGLLAGGARSA